MQNAFQIKKDGNFMYTIGVDLGGTNIAVGLCNEELKMIDKGSVPTRAQRDPKAIIALGL